MPERTPLLQHPLDAASVFLPRDLMASVRRTRGLPDDPLPSVCVLDCDGDLTDGLRRDGSATPVRAWACFHTEMLAITLDGVRCGVVPRTIGGPYAVLIAEQLHAAGAGVVVCLTSAGRVSPTLPLPSIVVADEAIRDEGTSLHYLPESRRVASPTPALAPHLARELRSVADVHRGCVWTTDAPYRETREQLRAWADEGVQAVEMQTAALFAFGHARGAAVATVAMVSNSTDHAGEQFDTGEHAYRVSVLGAVARGAAAYLREAAAGTTRPAPARADGAS